MHQSQIICKHQLLPTLYCARPCMCRHEYHTMAQITSRACILHQCIQWFFYLPSSDKTVGTLRHFLPNLTLVLTIHDIHDCRSVGERTTCYSTFIFWPPPSSHITTCEPMGIYMKWLSSFLWDIVCCHLLFLTQCFEMVYWLHLQGSGVQKTQKCNCLQKSD